MRKFCCASQNNSAQQYCTNAMMHPLQGMAELRKRSNAWQHDTFGQEWPNLSSNMLKAVPYACNINRHHETPEKTWGIDPNPRDPGKPYIWTFGPPETRPRRQRAKTNMY